MDKNQEDNVPGVPIRTRNIRKYYRMIAEVGSGTYGRVYKAECLRTKQYVALKKFESKDDKIKEDGFPITAVREIRLLKQLDHVNVIRLREIILSKPSERNDFRGSTFLVFDYMDHDFAGLHRNKHEFSLPELKCVMRQILLGVQYLHFKNVIHRDLKIANILYSNDGEVKIADFGLARSLNPSNPKYTNKVVTLWYRAPELLLGAKEYTQQIDVWSVGCILIELAVGENLLRGETEPRQLEKIYELCGGPNTQNWPEVDKLQHWKDMKPKRQFERRLRDMILDKKKGVDPELLNLLEGIMVLNPAKRFTVQQCLDHTFFKCEPLPLQAKQMPKIKEECHEALLKNAKNRQQVMISHKNNFNQRVKQSPSRLPPTAQSNQNGNKYSSSQGSSVVSAKSQGIGGLVNSNNNQSMGSQGNQQMVGSSSFDSRNKNQQYPQRQSHNQYNNSYSSNDQLSNQGSNFNNLGNYGSYKNKFVASQSQQLGGGDAQFRKQNSQLQYGNNYQYRSNEMNEIEQPINSKTIGNQKANSFLGLASLVEKSDSMERQNHIDFNGNDEQNHEQDDNEEQTADAGEDLSKLLQNKGNQPSQQVAGNNTFTYSSQIDAFDLKASSLNQKRQSPSSPLDIPLKKKIKEN